MKHKSLFLGIGGFDLAAKWLGREIGRGCPQLRLKIKTDKQVMGWEKFSTQSPIFRKDDKFSKELNNITFSKWRQESIKSYGNSVVPQLVYQIFKTINKYNL